MSKITSLSSGVAKRYAIALFNLCEEKGEETSLRKDVDLLSELLQKSDDFRRFMNSPIYTREQQELAVSALAVHLKLLSDTKKLLCLLARKGRLFILLNFINEVTMLLEQQRDEISVEVVSATKMTKVQVNQLETTISRLVEKKANINVLLDDSLIGGMIVKLGSTMIDTSTKSKLVKLQTKMKEVN